MLSVSVAVTWEDEVRLMCSTLENRGRILLTAQNENNSCLEGKQIPLFISFTAKLQALPMIKGLPSPASPSRTASSFLPTVIDHQSHYTSKLCLHSVLAIPHFLHPWRLIAHSLLLQTCRVDSHHCVTCLLSLSRRVPLGCMIS